METPFFTPVDIALFEARMVQLCGPVDSEMADKVNRMLMALEKVNPDAPIYIMINSPGGEISSGFSIYDTARFISCPVTTIVTGMAASMGSMIALCAKKKNRLAFPNSKFMIHQPSISGHIYGSASDLEINAKEILKTKEKINHIYADETGMSIEDVRAATDRDTWMGAEDALKFGLISRIVKSHSELTKGQS